MALFMLRHGRRFPSTVRFTSVFSNKGVVLNRSSRTRLPPPSPVAVAATAVRACSSHEQEQAKQAIKRFEVVPGPMFWIKSRIYYFLIKTFFDKDFNVKTFIEGATKAFSHVSRLQFDALEGLVAKELLGPMKLNYRWMPLHERQGLAADHIMSAIPNNVEFYTDTLGQHVVGTKRASLSFGFITVSSSSQSCVFREEKHTSSRLLAKRELGLRVFELQFTNSEWSLTQRCVHTG
ncbi:m-AAA protease-interacting protein 1, mitochondrial-like isoform X2 [Betta splendens]|uniref:M-AAA protease-interacting protein 1, mitochondrial-like isoform X2 n=1 Tax=Betta splendens TaxID=158456 RepID=A0A6P7LG79_BETSP|nr:m-AAA protease-interacting protein 1, mitochondrial-like isoform X2 [Betta splendens]